MELEFDKEIDAILRKARPARGVLVGDEPIEPKKHLDADAISAFAEGVLPDRVRLLYTGHLADCDRCRKHLSQTILFNSDASAAAVEAADTAIAGEASLSPPWYGKLFQTPNLALGMGALILAFAGALGYMVLQNRGLGDLNVSQTSNKMPEAVPYSGFDQPSAANAVAANSAANSSNAAASTSPRSPDPGMANYPTGSATSSNNETSVTSRSVSELPIDGRGTGGLVLDGVTAEERKPVAQPKPGALAAEPKAPAPPASSADTSSLRRESDRDKLKAGDDMVAKDEKERSSSRQDAEDRMARGNVTLSKKSTGGPLRSVGPVQNQSQTNAQVFDMPVTRVVGAKTFRNNNGAWYDSAYRGQATINVRRGTEEFRKLDFGLRSIANSVGGTVVVVWKDKAYRIQ